MRSSLPAGRPSAFTRVAAPAFKRFAVPVTLALAALAAGPALAAGGWSATHVIQRTFGVSSPPEAPRVVMNNLGQAAYVWNATGTVRIAERLSDGTWSASTGVPGGATGAGPVAVAIGRGGLVAVAWTTVATRYVPSKLLLSIKPAGGVFLPPVEPAPGPQAGAIELGVDCAGTVTLLWSDRFGVNATALAGPAVVGGVCNGAPGAGAWAAPVQVSGGRVGAALAAMAVNDAGDALVVWQEGAPGVPSAIAAASRPAGGAWQAPVTVSAPTAQATWNPKPGLDAAGNAAVGYLDGPSMKVALRPAAGAWQAPITVSGAQQVQYPALAVSDNGDVLAAWQAADAYSGTAVWQRVWHAGAWADAGRLSARSDTPCWPSAAMSGDGSLGVVTWTDDTALAARAATLRAGVWTRQSLGPAYWGGTVPVAAGGGQAAAGWARSVGGNPNAVQLVGRATP